MSDEFDINEVTSGVIESQIEGFLELARSTAKNWTHTVKLSWETAFKGYVKK